MINLAIEILWLVIGIVLLLAAVYLALYVIRMFTPIPDRLEQAIWVIVLLLCVIGVLSLLAGGGRLPFWRAGIAHPAIGAISAGSAADLPRMLGPAAQAQPLLG